MSESLFRQEALEANKTSMIGTVALYCPPYRWLIISLVGIIAIAVAAFFTFGTYTKRETAIGQLMPAKGIMNVASMAAGTVIDINVEEGQQVKKGDAIATVSSEVFTALGQTREKVAQQLQLQRERLRIDLEDQEKLFAEAIKGLQERERLLSSQLQQLEVQQNQRTRQASLARRQLKKLNLMREEGYASNSQVEQQEAAVIDADARMQDIARQRIDIDQQLAQTRQQLRELPINNRNKQNDIERRLSELEQSMAENESRRSIVLRAPIDGLVGSVMAKTGQMVSAGQTLFSVLPDEGHLQARIMVSSRAIGFIKPGQKVVLRYQAFPFQKFGQQYGKVVEVSRVALSPQEVATLTGNNNVQEQHYRVVVALDKQDINVYGHQEKLRPGSALEADFLIDTRHLYEWVLEPLYALGQRASN
ncbi:MAG: HlyD family efflux transporter periplasmic adaptor subunit [Mixta calida]|uniref:Anibiotic ABC transporter n=2 Tax=Mixta calida TaxID=665913 RepID=A0ABN5H5E1_9GAMM|nr:MULTISPECIES: HlyD family efflux transporter periplasmic adaptor subunit [Mixta]AIX75383.1 anibiotic ABC transporter [Pantoea sp. PSNIH2]MDU3817283.1 HlyD family efflux transporter periplasmic adaptor subunit [Pantoea sp.]POU46741.1 anibiotic ABC transporter [Pantoea sp. PSNIH5]POU67323.1 anibiotic ABC transporter [Pantoea sp. PSNIH4]POY67606.1 anibiotic ABC transporter [Pantoea sp. PSNIH3]